MKSIAKNILTSLVVLTLLISSTGLQVYKHTCAAHNYSAISLFETPVCQKDYQVVEETDDCCKANVKEIIEPNCCETEPIDEANPVSFTSQEIKCCISYIEGFQVQDNLFPPVEKIFLSLELITDLPACLEIENYQSKQILVLVNNSLPPPKFGKQLLQSIHQLKLDTSFC